MIDQETWDNLNVLQRFSYLVKMRRQNKHRQIDLLDRIKVLPSREDSYQKQQKPK